MRKLFLSLGFLCCLATGAWAALTFPTLTGRVVDEAGILSPTAQQTLTQSLSAHETKTGEQVVVVTLTSLQGTAIEDYGYQLGRAWGIGQKGKNNGVLLVVAPQERKVRIEVGYGLEDVLTDINCDAIVQNIILPDFRKGQMEAGIIDGTQAVLATLESGLTTTSPPSVTHRSMTDVIVQQHPGLMWGGGLGLTLITMIALVMTVTGHGNTGSFFGNFITNMVEVIYYIVLLLASGSRNAGGRGTGGGFGSEGGFSGGGGSFGGGGASGSW